MQKPGDIWTPALIAGATFGLLSGIPIVEILNYTCCCSLIVGAGILASFLLVRASPVPVTYGRAALSGMISGMVAAPIQSLTSLLLTILILGKTPTQQIEEAIDQASEYLPNAEETLRLVNSVPAAVWITLSTVLFILIFAPFGAVGGVIGRALFEKRVPPSALPEATGAGDRPDAGPAIQP